MSVRPIAAEAGPTLRTDEGELVSVRVSIDARSLEDLLDALAHLAFPVNPEIHHASPTTQVEFPAYVNHLGEVREAVARAGLRDCRIEATNMLALLQ
jgi:hypothetical protein